MHQQSDQLTYMCVCVMYAYLTILIKCFLRFSFFLFDKNDRQQIEITLNESSCRDNES